MQRISISIEKTLKFITKQITVRLEQYMKESLTKHKTSCVKSHGRTKSEKYCIENECFKKQESAWRDRRHEANNRRIFKGA